MGKVVVTEFVSLDGVMEDPGGAEDFAHGGWSFKFNRGDEGDKFKLGELESADAQLLGRKTYDGFSKAWPTMEDEVGFAEKMNTMPKYVVSSTLEDPDWENTTVVSGDLAAEVAKLKEEYDGDLLVQGSCQLAQALFDADLVDEWHLMVFPIVLGSGMKLFADGDDAKTLKLTDSTTVGEGVAILTLEPARD